MKFKYQGKNKEGELQVGYVEADSRDSAATILSSHDLFVMSIEEAESPGILDAVNELLSRPKRKDVIIFARQLATLLEARLPLNNALKILQQQTVNPKLKAAIQEVTQDIDAGLSFSQAMERQGKIFPSFYVEMIRASEVTGNLNEVAGFLADYTEKEGELVSKARSAMIYPIIVIVVFLLVAFILLAFVFPQLGAVFQQNNVQLPWYTETLLLTGQFLATWWPAILVALVILGIVGTNYFATREGEALLDEMKIRAPVVKKVYVPIIIARFANAAALLVHGGIPIAQALEVISHMVGNTIYQDAVHNIAEDVRQGELFSAGIMKYPDYFPALVSQMVSVGETSGKLEEMLRRLSNVYTAEADAMTGNLVELIQPALILGMGIMVGVLFASVLIPIYRLTANFS
ncbi:MAG TPA: type II secretion system F family protein [Candidatus Paceibacterota bacterium]|nr:type II secretion system F family protein [Candidatus Paceibacterota bacterium]